MKAKNRSHKTSNKLKNTCLMTFISFLSFLILLNQQTIMQNYPFAHLMNLPSDYVLIHGQIVHLFVKNQTLLQYRSDAIDFSNTDAYLCCLSVDMIGF